MVIVVRHSGDSEDDDAQPLARNHPRGRGARPAFRPVACVFSSSAVWPAVGFLAPVTSLTVRFASAGRARRVRTEIRDGRVEGTVSSPSRSCFPLISDCLIGACLPATVTRLLL